MRERALYSKEELASNVKVPTVVEQDLKRIISDKLEQCGLYYRVYSRIKTPTSMARKFELKDYGEDRKLQDLVGVRINLYFDDDVDICKDILEHTFDLLEWSTSQRQEDEFKPAKLNGVFRLPMYLKDEISESTWEMCIDDTFEVQIKTMFFEGWHEIEHDMRYKGEELWSGSPGFSRYLNSILATLELCDKSMITLFEDIGHTMYKSGRWNDMIKSHFRMKIGDVRLYPEVEEYLTEDKVNGGSIAKQIYKTPKSVVVDCLLKRSRKIPVNANTIVALLNDNLFHDGKLANLLRLRNVYNDGREDSLAESRHYELRPLVRQNVFQMCTQVDGNRIKNEEDAPSEIIFKRSAELIYRWIVKKYGGLFMNMPINLTSFHADILAYHVTVNYDQEKGKMNMHVRHMDPDIGGRIWYSEASLFIDREDKVMLKVCNGFAEPTKDGKTTQEGAGLFFSYPGYYKSIVDNVGIRNGINCSNKRRILTEEDIPDIIAGMKDEDRVFPIVMICSDETEDQLLDEGWLGEFRVSDFTRAVWRYAHVFTSSVQTMKKLEEEILAAGLKTEMTGTPGMKIFWPDGTEDTYGPEDVQNCSFGRHYDSRGDSRTYDFVRGGQGFYHQIVTDLRAWNISAKMWSGFQLEIMTEIPR